MAGYLASREHEVEPAQSETITYPGKSRSVVSRATGYEYLTTSGILDMLIDRHALPANLVIEISNRMSWKS